jgi:mannose-6-phosphate isomerase-like protein (cupin superfamily)
MGLWQYAMPFTGALYMAVDIATLIPSGDTINITHRGEIFAMILPRSFNRPGVSFFTPAHFSQQLAYIQHSGGHVIQPHIHQPVERQVTFTNEVLLLRKGRMRVDFYDDEQQYLASYLLSAGDVILLIRGGHGFEILEDAEMIEVKQGPYAEEKDKVRFAHKPRSLRYYQQS